MLSWQQRIDNARKLSGGWFTSSPRGFTEEDRNLANDWMTCSCGQLDARIPRNLTDDEIEVCGVPLDDELYVLGMKFTNAVEHNEIDRAEVLYRKIQARAELLIEQIEKGDNQCPTNPSTEATTPSPS